MTIVNQGGSINGALGGYTGFSNNTTAGSATLTNNGGQVNGAAGGSTTFADSATAGSAIITNNGATISGATGGFTAFFNNSTAGTATIITNGGTGGNAGGVTYFHDGADGGTARAITNGNGVFDLSGLSDDVLHIGSIEGSGVYDLGRNTLIVGSNNLSTTVTGVIADGGQFGGGGGSLEKTGTGTLTLAGANTYTGTTTISGGTLQIGTTGAAGSLDNSLSINVNAGTTLSLVNLVANTFSNHATVGSGGIGTFNINSSNANTISGALMGQLALTQTGTGTTTLTNVFNSFSGTTTVSNGTLQIGTSLNTGSIGGGAITVTSGSTFSLVNISGNTFANNVTAGPGSVQSNGTFLLNSANTNTLTGAFTDGPLGGQVNLVQSGTGTAILTNSPNTYTGTTTISNGTLQVGRVGSGGSIGSGAISIFAGGTLALINTTSSDLTNAISNSGTGTGVGTLNIGLASDNTISGALSDNGSGHLALIQSGAGITTLTNASNAYTGTTTITAGTLQVGTAGDLATTGSASALGSGAVSIGSGSTLSLVNLGGNSFGNTVSNGIGGTSTLDIHSANTNTLSGVLSDGALGQLVSDSRAVPEPPSSPGPILTPARPPLVWERWP